MLYLSIKSLHILSIICWMASLLYLVRLFVYHAKNKEKSGSSEICNQLSTMERRLLKGIGNPSMLASIIFGIWLIVLNPSVTSQLWFLFKFCAVILLMGYHMYCGSIRKKLEISKFSKSSNYLRALNEVSTVLMVFIVFLVETNNVQLSSLVAACITFFIAIVLKLTRKN